MVYINDFLKNKLDNYLHKNPEFAESLQKKIIKLKKKEKNYLVLGN